VAAIVDAPDQTPEQKLEALAAKYLEKAHAHKRTQAKLADATARTGVVAVEKDALMEEYRKVGPCKLWSGDGDRCLHHPRSALPTVVARLLIGPGRHSSGLDGY